MSKKWKTMTKNQKLNSLHAEIAMIALAVDTLIRRLDHAERHKSKNRVAKVNRAPEKTLPLALSLDVPLNLNHPEP
jgi:hypothetical protein